MTLPTRLSGVPRQLLAAVMFATVLTAVTGCVAVDVRPTATSTQATCAESPQTLLHNFANAFNAHDASALAALFSNDANFVNIYGQLMEGRAGIEAGHEQAFRSRLTVADLTINEVREQTLSTDEYLLYGDWSLTQPDSADPAKIVPAGSGILTAVAACTSGQWELRGAANVRKSAPPS